MIEARWLGTDEVEQWPRILEDCGGGPLHLDAVHLVDDAEHLVLREGDRDLACALALTRAPGKLRRWIGGTKSLELPTAPAVVDPGRREEIRAALFDAVLRAGYSRLVVHPAASDWLVDDEDLAAHRSDAIAEFVLDLRADMDAIQSNMHKQHRKNVRRAGRDGVEIREDSGLDGLLRLREMQLASSQRAEERAEGFGVGDEAFFARLHERVYAPGIGHVAFAWLDGEAVAALAWLQWGGRVQTVRSGSLPAGYRSRAMYLLYDHLIRRAKDQGAIELNCGGVPVGAESTDHPQSGLYEFKNGFGGEVRVRHGLDLPLGEICG